MIYLNVLQRPKPGFIYLFKMKSLQRMFYLIYYFQRKEEIFLQKRDFAKKKKNKINKFYNSFIELKNISGEVVTMNVGALG